MADAANTAREITIDVSPASGPREARVWNVLTRQWFDFSTMKFGPSPVKQKSAPLEPVPDNPFLRSCPFATLPPGEYKLYACPVGADDFDAVSDQEILDPAKPDGRAVNITINQPR